MIPEYVRLRSSSSAQSRYIKASAFTLLELIVVISVMTLLMSLAGPIVTHAFTATQITIGAQTVVDQLNQARQTALAQNRVVETRFYKYISSENVDKTEQTRAVQNVIFDETNTHSSAVDEVRYLPDGAVVSSVSTYSSLIQPSREKTTWSAGDAKLALPRGIGKNYTVYAVRFRPDGSTDLGAGSWFATVRSENGPSKPPANYATVYIDPYNGSLRLYRPGL